MQFYEGTTAKFYIVAVDETDLTTRETGLTSFTGYISQNGGSASLMSMSVTEVDSTTMTGVYYVSFTMPSLTAGNDFEEAVVHITHAGMAPVSRAITIARPKFTAGSTLTTASIADSVWDESISGHTTGGTLGWYMSNINSEVTSTDTNVGFIKLKTDQMSFTGGSIDARVDSASLTNIGDTVWDEDITGHVSNTASTGYHLNNIMDVQAVQGLSISSIFSYTGEMDTNGLNTPLGIRNAVWNATASSFNITGTTGALLNTAASGGSAPTAAEIADAVWDEAQADHITSGSFGVIANEIAVLDNKITIVDNLVDLIFADTHELQQNQGDWATATGFPTYTTADIADAVWDESISAHTTAGSFGKGFKQVKEGLVSAESQVNDASATASSFVTDLTSSVDDYYVGKCLVFISGSLIGQSRVIADYTGSSKTITFDEAFTSAPADDDQFIILSLHAHTITEIKENVADQVWDEPQNDHITTGTFGVIANEIAILDNKITIVDNLVDLIFADTNELQQNQGNWLTATGFSTLSAQDVADAVWDEQIITGGHTLAGSFGGKIWADLDAKEDIADSVWNELRTGHTAAGTFGSFLDAAVSSVGGGTAPTAAEIADAVWDELASDHTTTGSFGDYLDAEVSGVSAGSAPTAQDIYDYFNNGTRPDAFKADVSGLPTASQIADQVWNEATSGHVLTGSFGYMLQLLPDEASIADQVWDEAISGHTLGGTFGERLQQVPTTSQIADQVWDEALTSHTLSGSTGEKLYTLSSGGGGGGSAPTEAQIYSYFTSAGREDLFKADVSGLATSTALTVVDDVVDAIKVKTDQLNFTVSGQVDANALTGGDGDDAATIYSYFTSLGREDGFKADITGLATSADVAALNDITATDVLNLLLANASAFKADTSGLARITDTDALDTLIDSVKAKTDQLSFTVAGQVDANALTSVADTSASEIYDYFTDLSREDVFKADVSSLASQASVDSLNDPSVAEITSGLQAVSNDFKADVSGLATSAEIAGLNDVTAAEVVTAWGNQPQNVFVTAGTLGYYLDGRISELSAAGSGLHQLTVTVTDDSAVPLQGARVNIDGTNLTLTTPSNGTVVFNLDNGSYTVSCSPPAGYDTPANESATIIDADTNASFALTLTNPPSGGGDVDWVG